MKFIRQFSSFLTTLKSFVLPLLLHKTVHALNHWFSSCTTLVARVHCKCIGLGCIITILSSVAIFDFLLPPPRSKKCHKNLWKCRDFWLWHSEEQKIYLSQCKLFSGFLHHQTVFPRTSKKGLTGKRERETLHTIDNEVWYCVTNVWIFAFWNCDGGSEIYVLCYARTIASITFSSIYSRF